MSQNQRYPSPCEVYYICLRFQLKILVVYWPWFYSVTRCRPALEDFHFALLINSIYSREGLYNPTFFQASSELTSSLFEKFLRWEYFYAICIYILSFLGLAGYNYIKISAQNGRYKSKICKFARQKCPKCWLELD